MRGGERPEHTGHTTAEADLLIGCDLVVSAGAEAIDEEEEEVEEAEPATPRVATPTSTFSPRRALDTR